MTSLPAQSIDVTPKCIESCPIRPEMPVTEKPLGNHVVNVRVAFVVAAQSFDGQSFLVTSQKINQNELATRTQRFWFAERRSIQTNVSRKMTFYFCITIR